MDRLLRHAVPRIAVLCGIAIVTGPALATDLCGPVSGTLGASGNPHVVICDVSVAPSDTLTLEAGVEFRFVGGTRMTVYGGLQINGSSTDPVVLTCDDPSPGPGCWGPLELDGTADLAYAIVRYGSRSSVTGTATVTGSRWELNFDGLVFEAGGSGSVNGGSFNGNTGFSVATFAGSGAVTVDGASFDGNGVPVYVSQDTFPSLSDLTAVNHANHGGVELESFVPWAVSGTLTDPGIPYVVFGDLTVAPGATMTIDPGVTIKVQVDPFDTRELGFDGLVVNGSAARPVTFTSFHDDAIGGDTNRDGTATTPSPGDRAGLRVPGSASLTHTTVRYASRSSVTGTATVTGSRWEMNFDGLVFEAGGSGSVNGGSFTGNTGFGVATFPGSGAVTVNGASFAGNGVPVYVSQDTFPSLSGLTASSHANHGGVELESFVPWTISGTLTDPGIPYVVFGDLTVDTGATLTLSAGASIKVQVDPFDARELGFDGLVVNGSAERPVTFTSFHDDAIGGDTNRDGTATSPSPGDWAGLRVPGSASLTHATVRYASRSSVTGTATVTDSLWELNFDGLVFEAGGAGSVNGGSFTGNTGFGVATFPGSGAVTVDGASFDGNGVPVYVSQDTFPSLSGLTAMNHANHGGVELESFVPWTISGTLTDPGIPYVVFGDLTVDTGATLTIDPGVTLKVQVDPFDTRELGFDGLVVDGSAAQPVTFTSFHDDAAGGDTNRDGTATAPAPGDWSGLRLHGSTSYSLTGARVRYADKGITVQSASAVLDGVRLQDCWMGLAFMSGAGGVVRNSDIVDNSTGAFVDASSLPVFGDLGDSDPANDGGNQFLCNLVNLDHSNALALKAEGNWWMDAPPDPGSINGVVDLDPYLTESKNTIPEELRVAVINGGADLQLVWDRATASCGLHVLRSGSLSAGFVDISGLIIVPSYVDAGAGSDGAIHFYVVVGD